MDSNELPSDADIRKEMEKMVRFVDIEKTTTKQFIKLLSDQMGIDLKPKKDFIKSNLTAVLDEMESDEEQGIDEDSDDDDSEASNPTRSKPRRPRGKGILIAKELSPEMAAFMGSPEAARTDVVKQLWVHIRKEGLQNPNNKQEIFLDERLKQIFKGVDKMTMFSLNKYISPHIHPFKTVNIDEPSQHAVKRKAENKETKGPRKEPKKRKAGTQPPWRLSENLAAVVGKEILPRPQVVQKLWVYIREHNLQNPNDKREIICDELLQRVMGGKKKVTIFSMTQHIAPNLIEKVDKSAYTYDGQEGGD